MLTRLYFAPCFVRGATDATVEAHRRAASASPGDTAAQKAPAGRAPQGGPRRPTEPRPRQPGPIGPADRHEEETLAAAVPTPLLLSSATPPETASTQAGAMTPPAHTAGQASPAYLSG